MSDKLKVAMIGAGGIARNHADALNKFADVEIVGHADVAIAKAEERAVQYGGQAFSDAAEMLDRVQPDAAWVCLPPHCHGEAEMALIERRIPFLVEKPLHNSRQGAQRILEAIQKAGLLVAVGYMTRYRRSVNRVRELVAADPPVLIHGGWIGGLPGVHWWRVKAQSGGQIVEQTTHTFDLLRYLAGEAETVCAMAARGFIKDVPDYDVEDASSVVIQMRSGAVANLVSCCACRAGGGVHLTLACRDLFVSFSGWNHDVVIRKSPLEEERIIGENNIFEIEDRAFLDAVKANDPGLIRSDYADGFKTLHLCLAANEALETGKPVRV